MTVTHNNLPEAVSFLCSEIETLKNLLLLQSSSSLTEPEDDNVLIDEAARIVRLQVPTVYGLVSKRLIPVSKVGKRLYFSRRELNQWMRSGKLKTTAEVQIEADAFLGSSKQKAC